MQLRPRHLALALILGSALTHAQLSPTTVLLPTGIASDSAGNLYFADANRHQVFEATLGGQLILIAGSGTQGFSGDAGLATAAQLNSPQAIAIGSDGTLYIADTGNHRIRSIAANGIITTIAGTGIPGFSGNNSPAITAQLASPNALSLDATGTLYIADSGNHRVRRIVSGTITTVAGSGTQGFSGDNGPAISAQLDTPSGIAVAPTGTIYIADTHNHRIRAINSAGVINTIAGAGQPGYSGDQASATLAQLDSPRGLAIASTGALLIADANNQRIRSVDSNGTITTLAGGAAQGDALDATPALSASLNSPRSVGLTSFGYAVLADASNHTLRILASDGNLYLPAALTSRTSTVSVSAPGTTTFGQPTVTITVTGSASTPLGSVELLQNGIPVATAALSSGSAIFPLSTTPAGSYTLAANYTGDGINPAATSANVTLNILRAPTATTTQPPVQNTYASLPLLLHADVTSTTKGTPTGTVNFIDTTASASPVATAQLTNGIASSVYLAPTAGNHSIVASYLGDTNFAPSSSPAVIAAIQPQPDFTVSSTGSTTQTVTAGFIATYNLAVAPVAAPFTGAVSMSVAGLPFGATASFAPPQLVPGAASVPTILSVQTLAPTLVQLRGTQVFSTLAFLTLPLLFLLTHKGRGRIPLALLMLCLVTIVGCGTRINQPPSASAGVYNLTISATGTNLAGATVVHTTSVSLNIR